MTFIVILIGLLIERFFDWSHIRQWTWYDTCQRFITQKLSAHSPYLILSISILPLTLVVAIIELSLHGFLYGLISLLFDLFVLLYCFGPRNLWADTFACINALEKGDLNAAVGALKVSFGITSYKDLQNLHRQFLNGIFNESNRRIFTVLFWFAILGPAGAFLYRAITTASQDVGRGNPPPDIAESSRKIEAILDWLPIRLYTFLFALAGQFVQVLQSWRKYFLYGLAGNDLLLDECGTVALVSDSEQQLPEDCSVEKNAISLLDRVFVIVLVIVAIEAILI